MKLWLSSVTIHLVFIFTCEFSSFSFVTIWWFKVTLINGLKYPSTIIEMNKWYILDTFFLPQAWHIPIFSSIGRNIPMTIHDFSANNTSILHTAVAVHITSWCSLKQICIWCVSFRCANLWRCDFLQYQYICWWFSRRHYPVLFTWWYMWQITAVNYWFSILLPKFMWEKQ